MERRHEWVAFWILGVSVVVIMVVWVAAQPLFLRLIDAFAGKLSRR